MIDLFNMDCMEYMAVCEDNAFDLAIVDPPYGIERFKKGGSLVNVHGGPGMWNNNKPNKEYFSELFRVSENQVIWGSNNFSLPVSEYFIFWDKCQSLDNFADGELAFVSMGLKTPAKYFRYAWSGLSDGIVGKNNKIKRIHPTQKPIPLYSWLLNNYSKPGQRILDTHLGSGSSAIAAHYFGCDFVGTELDPDYFQAAQQRFNDETKQQAMF